MVQAYNFAAHIAAGIIIFNIAIVDGIRLQGLTEMVCCCQWLLQRCLVLQCSSWPYCLL